MIVKRDFSYTPKNANRPLHIWLPENWETSGKRYPVMYFFDGHNLFSDEDATYGKSWGLKDFLENWKKDMIVVGIECGHGEGERLSEYLPYPADRGSFCDSTPVLGDATLRWMVEELKPVIDRDYRTMPFRECTAIGGSSMGGLMSLYAAIKYNRFFSKAACLSSTTGPCMEDFREDITNTDMFEDTRVYLSWGSEEGGGSKLYPRDDTNDTMAGRNVELAARISEKGCITRIYGQPGGHHCEADWEKQVPMFMNFLWMDR